MLPGLVWSADAGGHTDFYDREFLHYLGRSPASTYVWTWFDSAHPDDRQAATTAWNTAIATGQPYAADLRILRADDQAYRWFAARARPFFDQRGSIVRWYGTVTDVHDRVEAQETSRRLADTLQRYTEVLSSVADSSAGAEEIDRTDPRRAVALQSDSQTRLQLALTAGHLGIWEWDVLTNEIKWSPEAARMAGAAAGQSTGVIDDFVSRIHPEDRERQWKVVEQALASPGLDYTSEFRTVDDTGHVRWVANRGAVLRDLSGRPIRMIGVVHDISAQVEQRESINRSQRLLQAIVDNAPVSIAYCTTDHRYRLVNQAYADRVGLASAQCIGRTLGDVLGEAAWRAVEAKFNEAAAGHQVEFDVELSFETVGTRLLNARYVPHRSPDGRVDGVVVLIEDVTEKRQAESQLRNNDARKAEFMAVLSHELRNHLAPLVTAAAVLRTRTDERDANVYRVLHRQLSQLTRLTDDLLDMTRINLGQLDLHRTALDLGDVIRTTVDSILPRSAAKQQTMTVDVSEQPLRIFADRGRLMQVLTNLLINAVKFTPERGTIVIRTQREAEGIRVDVSDSGIGIAPDLLPHVFDAFKQADTNDSKAREGLGLGLNIVKKLVEAHGGSVRASSEGLGTGACITVWLPNYDG
jgi:PAS domain S-box-containing protein